ncbi:hypothetical protein T12_16834 [Trichinella patagoniensis]|uniref:Uncharacterized protein n=1 Tax=Trichinella patagoniensis TaxID=990121 RepID=A0A0V0YX49_9BILA|nr:hypothetical protein T12_16834 [Trichinella patagoniensis]
MISHICLCLRFSRHITYVAFKLTQVVKTTKLLASD